MFVFVSGIIESFGERVSRECIPAYRSLINTTIASGRAAITLRQSLIGAVGALSKVFDDCVLGVQQIWIYSHL